MFVNYFFLIGLLMTISISCDPKYYIDLSMSSIGIKNAF